MGVSDEDQREIDKLLAVQEQTTEQLELLEARERSIRELIQDIADSEELAVHAEDIIETKKIFILDCIETFQRSRTLEDVISGFTTLFYLCLFFLKQSPEILKHYEGRIKYFTKLYMKWNTEYRLRRVASMAFFSRAMKPAVTKEFYSVVDILLNTKLITSADILDYRQSYADMLKEVDKTTPKAPDQWSEKL